MEKFPGQVSVAGGECIMLILEAGFKVDPDLWLGNWVEDGTIYLIE